LSCASRLLANPGHTKTTVEHMQRGQPLDTGRWHEAGCTRRAAHHELSCA
jgi:hypothetical protein